MLTFRHFLGVSPGAAIAINGTSPNIIAMLIWVLEHIPKPTEVLGKLQGILKPHT